MSQDKAPAVSIVVPCYNHGGLIHETIASIAKQTFTDWECIIVNDGSTDNSEEVCLKLAASDPRIRYFSQQNKGPSGARNRGIEEIRGRYVQFIDADDVILEDKIRVQVADLAAVDGLALAYCDFEWCDETGKVVDVPWQWRVRLSETNPLHDVALNWHREVIIPPCCFLFDARLFAQHGVREDENLRANEDYDLLLNILALAPRCIYQDQKLARYRIVQGSVSKNRPRLRSTYFYILDKQSREFASDREMSAILREKRRRVKRDFWEASRPYEAAWWIFRLRLLARRVLSPASYQRAKRLLDRGQV